MPSNNDQGLQGLGSCEQFQTRSGVCFMSSALSKRVDKNPVHPPQGGMMHRPPEWEREPLHNEVLETVASIINEAFGRTPWYQKLMSDLSGIPKDRLLPRLPCSAVWFTSNPNAFKWHVDTNTMGSVFAFCLNTARGGELQVMMPKETVEVRLKEGVVLGGIWAQYPHANKPVAPGEERHSFIVYLDKRVLNSQYWTQHDFQEYNEKMNRQR